MFCYDFDRVLESLDGEDVTNGHGEPIYLRQILTALLANARADRPQFWVGLASQLQKTGTIQISDDDKEKLKSIILRAACPNIIAAALLNVLDEPMDVPVKK